MAKGSRHRKEEAGVYGAGPLERAVWAAFASLTAMSLDDLEVITGFRSPDLLPYLNVLLCNGYVAIGGVAKAQSGETVVKLRQVRRTGPQPPVELADGRFMDPNESHYVQNGALMEVLPRCRTWIRIIARDLGTFTRESLVAAVTERWGYRSDVLNAVSQLKYRGELVTADAGMWRIRPDEIHERIHAYLTKWIGQPVTSAALVAGCGYCSGSQWLAVLEIFSAEGYRVTIRRRSSNERVYLIEETE